MAVLALPRLRRRPVTRPRCPDCRGGGEVNGVPCRGCSGSRPKARRPLGWALLGALATPAGTVVRWSMSLPGVAGAAGVTFGVSVIVHAVFRQVPALGVAALVAGAFALLLDRRL